jgi:hypothetical protein
LRRLLLIASILCINTFAKTFLEERLAKAQGRKANAAAAAAAAAADPKEKEAEEERSAPAEAAAPYEPPQGISILEGLSATGTHGELSLTHSRQGEGGGGILRGRFQVGFVWLFVCLFVVPSCSPSQQGLRAIRYCKEIESVRQVVANDFSADAVAAIRRNIEFNGIPPERILSTHGDARCV